jgi:hypothetical protein
LTPPLALHDPVQGLQHRVSQPSLADGLLSRRHIEEQNLGLDVAREEEQVHDLRDPRPGEAKRSSHARVVSELAGVDPALERVGEGELARRAGGGLRGTTRTDADLVDQIAGCTVQEATLALGELVKLQAPRWNNSSLKQIPWLATSLTRALVRPELVGAFLDRFGARLTPEHVAPRERALPRCIANFRSPPGGSCRRRAASRNEGSWLRSSS